MKAFLSHTSADKDIVQLVHERLTAERAWFDATDIENGDSIFEKINDGLRYATHFVLFWSQRASNAPWVRAELGAAYVQMMASKCKLMIFSLDDTKLPELLQPYKYDKVDMVDLNSAADTISQKILAQEGTASALSSFINRTPELGEIEESVRAEYKLIILNGILGVGKSSLADKALQWLYPNRATNRIVVDFNAIPGLAELALELSRITRQGLINDNLTIDNQKENIRYFFEQLSVTSRLVILKDVKRWLDEDGSPNKNLMYVTDLIINTSMFEYAIIMTTSRYIEVPYHYYEKTRQFTIRGMDDVHIADIINNNLSKNFPSDQEKNYEFAKRLYGYPLGAKLGAYRISNHGYEYYLSQPQKINDLKVGLAKQLISYAGLSDDCLEYLKIVAISQSRLRNEEYAVAFPSLARKIAQLSDEAFFAGILRFDDDNRYKLEPLVEDYFYDCAFNAPNRKSITSILETFLIESLDNSPLEKYMRLIPAVVHVLILNNKVGQALSLRSELTATFSSSMWDQYNHREYDDAHDTANKLLSVDAQNIEALYVKSLCLTRFDEYDTAEKILNDLLECDSDSPARYYYALGRIQKRRGDFLKAIEYFQLAVMKKRKYLSPHREMAECYLHMDMLDDAKRELNKAKVIDDSNMFVILLEARMLQKENRAEAAIELLSSQSIMEQDPAQILFRKGRAFDQLGNIQNASECYEMALQYNPKSYDAKLCLLNHQITDEPVVAEKEIASLKPKLHGKRRYILKNIEARFVGYYRHDEDGALDVLDSVPRQFRDIQWYAVRFQLIDNLIQKHLLADRKIIANQLKTELDKVSTILKDKYGRNSLSIMDFLPDT